MAKKRNKQGLQNTSKVESRSFQKGMVKDLNESIIGEGTYLNAINATNNSLSGDLGVVSNEPSNKFCTKAPYTIIGTIHLYDDKWAIYSTDNTESEVGLFDESECSYITVVNDPCLGFKKTNLIIGEAKENFDCTWQTYWADGLNPDRSLNMDKPPFIQDCNPDPNNPDCIICVDTEVLDCERTRMARITIPPCIKLAQGPNGGEMLNGTYQVSIAYTENEQRVSDYSTPSNVISMFDHRNVNGSLEVTIENIDETYDEFELVVISAVNQNTVAKSMGIYSTHQNSISIDAIPPSLITVPLRLLILDRPAYEKSEGIYRNGEHLLRVAPSTRFSFNYQPLANQINTDWVGVEYDAEYYRRAGTNTSYLRDEQYAFFIRWVYETNDRSESYHIPGRAPFLAPDDFDILTTLSTSEPEILNGTIPYRWRVLNTATITTASGTTADGGDIVAKGKMGYWESSERYPDKNPDVWGDLCGKNIRHHKMPDNRIINHFRSITATDNKIVVLGVQFSNIPFPLDNSGDPIPGIAGYEILRGSREGNKTVIAKGLLNNMGKYDREDNGETVHYQNYPYNDLRADPFLSQTLINGDKAATRPLGFYDNDVFTFHSPDTQFKHPFLSAQELKIYESLWGVVSGKYDEVYRHPKHKLPTDGAFILAALVGFGIASLALTGEEKRTRSYPIVDGIGQLGAPPTSPTTLPTEVAAATAVAAYWINQLGLDTTEDIAGLEQLLALVGATPENLPSAVTMKVALTGLAATPAVSGGTYVDEYNPHGKSGLPGFLRVAQSIPTFVNYWGQGTDNTLEIVKLMSKWRQYAIQFQSHCHHNRNNLDRAGIRTVITDAGYISDGLQEFGGVTVNNLFRSSCLAITTSSVLPDPTIIDTSRQLASHLFNGASNVEVSLGKEVIVGRASAHYVGLKTRFANQYGQVDGVIQVPTGTCLQLWKPDPANPPYATSDVIFGGDTYIGRYTEKNSFFYFSNWMHDLPDGFEYDYRLRKMMPFPTYWMDTTDYDLNKFFQGLIGLVNAGGTSPSVLPNDFHNFDRGSQGTGFLPGFGATLIVKDAYMYLFSSGVRDFFVESEVNVEYRDWEDEIERRHYDAHSGGYKSYDQLFRSDRIKTGNFYKYDYSLSISRLYQNFASWGNMQYRNYDPQVAEDCYTFYPNRVIYSLPQNLELRYDNWLLYLVNNYKDFTSRVTAIKAVGRNGAMMLFENEAPALIPGVDTLQTTSGTKITIGDGGLFSQPLQNIVNADQSYEYGSCQNKLSVINTPAGLFWISRNQGKIFQYTGQLKDISQQGMKWWFEEFLPYKINEDFPDFELIDNPVVGVGCQSIYNNNDGIVYFTKKDYKLKPEFAGQVTYDGATQFSIRSARFNLGDPRYFDDASWTVSYDPKNESWVSFHDWHPNLMVPGKNQHMTIVNESIWVHNDRSDNYCNFYGVDHPFQVDMVIPTGQSVNTLKSVEYIMEVYRWADDVDRFHVLDFNFDRAVIYNSEQVSGELRMNITPKNNAPAIINYPIVNPTSMDILYSKEEQKYRFNQFWDVTDDRGEFTGYARLIWNTESNGYVRTLNPINLNYAKPSVQRKKFRHYNNNIRLTRLVSGPHNMQLKIVNTKNQYSMR